MIKPRHLTGRGINKRGQPVDMILVDSTTGSPAQPGIVVNMRGEEWTLYDATPPHHSSSSGRVHVKHMDYDYPREFYPSVFGLEWVEQQSK